MTLPNTNPNQNNQPNAIAQAMAGMQGNINVLQGVQDPRGPVGIFSRGNPIYNAGSFAAHSGGGPQFGRPPGTPNSATTLRDAISRRMGGQQAPSQMGQMGGGGMV